MLLNDLLSVSLQVGLIILLVDFLSGVFHWLEDSYGSEHTPFFGPIVVLPNIVHHRQPREFTKSPIWRRNSVTLFLSVVTLALGLWCIGPSWQLYLVCALGAMANELHCWAHRSPEENGRLITFLHRCYLLQTPTHHAVHHTDPKNRAYCVLTNCINPVLDRIEFWRRTEAMVFHVLRVQTRPDPSVKILPPEHAPQSTATGGGSASVFKS